MKRVVVGSKNQTKLSAVESAFERIGGEYEIFGRAASSNVPDQPMDDVQMYQGALNRALNGIAMCHEAPDYAFGLEGGLRHTPAGWYDLGWVCVVDVPHKKIGYGITPAIRVPESVLDLMLGEDKLELSEAVEAVYGSDTVASRDCSGVITGGLMPADELYTQGVLAAYADLQNRITTYM